MEQIQGNVFTNATKHKQTIVHERFRQKKREKVFFWCKKIDRQQKKRKGLLLVQEDRQQKKKQDGREALFFASFFFSCLSSCTRRRQFLSKVLVYYCLLVFRRVGECISQSCSTHNLRLDKARRRFSSVSVALRPQRKNIRTIRDGEPRTSTSTFTQLLSSAECGSPPRLLRRLP